jgi:hypothetical protein
MNYTPAELVALPHVEYLQVLYSKFYLDNYDRIVHRFDAIKALNDLSETSFLLFNRKFDFWVSLTGTTLSLDAQNYILKAYNTKMPKDVKNFLRIRPTRCLDLATSTAAAAKKTCEDRELTAQADRGFNTLPSPSVSPKVAAATNSFRPTLCISCKSPDHKGFDCPIECTRCPSTVPSHVGKDCKLVKQELKDIAERKARKFGSDKCKLCSFTSRSVSKSPTSISAALDSAANGVFLSSQSLVSNFSPYESSDPRRRINVANGEILLAAGSGYLGTSSIPVDVVPNISMNLLGLSSIMAAGMIGVCTEDKFVIMNGTSSIMSDLQSVII